LSLSASNPPLKSVHVASAASSWQRLWVQDILGSGSTPRRVRVRFEGYSTPAARQAGVDVVWEAWFWSNNTLALCVGAKHALAAKAGPLAGVSNGNGRWLASFQPLALNSLYSITSL
jgi:hypothetical protein